MALGRRLVSLALSVCLAGFLVVGMSGGARACACGAYIPSEDQATASGEHSMVWWDGKRESIDLRMIVQGQSEDAAWIMPAPPGTTVRLGDADVFETLASLTRPRVEQKTKWWPPSFLFIGGGSGQDGAGAVDSGVQVTARSDVGPFRVTTLSGRDEDAVNDWLRKHGYPTQPDLPGALAPYLEQGWDILAVKLRPERGKGLSGTLEPLRMEFAADEPVYPIRLSHAAHATQNLRMYVVAPHRMDIADEAAPEDPAEVAYAGWVDTAELGHGDDGRVFLTRYDAQLDPAAIQADYTFERAHSDAKYQRVEYSVDDRTHTTGALIALAVLALAVFLGIRAALRRWW